MIFKYCDSTSIAIGYYNVFAIFYFLYAILGGFKGRLHATGDVVYFLYAILGGFKGR